MRATYLMTFRDDGGSRLANLRVVFAHLARFADLEIVVVEQDRAPQLAAADLPANGRLVFVYNPGPFNKGWGLNVGFYQARCEVLVLADADLLVPLEALKTAVGLCGKRFDAVRPFGAVADLTPEETGMLGRGETALEAVRPERLTPREVQGEHPGFCSGLFLIQRMRYFQMGGFDERFIGWGGEDDAMTIRLSRHTGNVAVLEQHTALHLWHPRQLEAPGAERWYAGNLRLLEDYRAYSDVELATLCGVQRRIMGDPNKYWNQQNLGRASGVPTLEAGFAG